MKLILLLLLGYLTLPTFGQVSVTTTATSNQLPPTVSTPTAVVPSPVPNPGVAATTPAVGKTKAAAVSPSKTDLNFGQWLLVYLPFLLFLFLFSYFMRWLKKDGYKLSEALSSCEPMTFQTNTQTVNPETGATTVAVTQQDVLPRSSSRFIAFVTGFTAVGIAVAIATFFIYDTLDGGPATDFDGIWQLLAALGIGVIPYGFNMLKEASKSNS